MEKTADSSPALRIDGDVDDRGGSIDTDRDVRVTGSVRANLGVRTEGSVAVGADVEAGAEVNAGGDVAVCGGIVGARVVAMGGVRAGHIRDGEVMARGEVAAGRVDGARVRAGARLVVDNGGNITGGEAYAVAGLEVGGTVGALSGQETVVGLMADPDAAARLAKVREGLAFCEADIMRIMRTLGLRTVSKAEIQVMFQRTPPSKRKFAIGILKQLNQLVKVREELQEKGAQHEARRDQVLRDGEIRILGTAYAGVHIRIGEADRVLSEALDRPIFSLTDHGIQTRIQDA